MGGAKFVVFLIPCLCVHIFYVYLLVLYVSSLSVFLFSRLVVAYDVRVCVLSPSLQTLGGFPPSLQLLGGLALIYNMGGWFLDFMF